MTKETELTNQQLKAIDALLAGKGRAEAAEAAGCDRVTLWRWLSNDANFVAHLSKRRQQISDSMKSLHASDSMLTQAIDVLEKMLSSNDELMKLNAVELLICMKDQGQIPEKINLLKLPKRKAVSNAPEYIIGYIYLLRADLPNRPCKIGKSKNLPDRLRIFNVKLPFDFELLHIIPCDDHHVAETLLHKRYESKRGNGEWFDLNETDITEICTIDNYQNGEWIITK